MQPWPGRLSRYDPPQLITMRVLCTGRPKERMASRQTAIYASLLVVLVR